MRWPYAVLAYVFAGVAIAGVVIPGLPTTPFVLLAAWAASRGSKRLHDWLTNHPRLGPPLADWREQRAVSTQAKLLAVSLMSASWAIMAWRGVSGLPLTLITALFVGVASFVVTRPRPHSPADEGQSD